MPRRSVHLWIPPAMRPMSRALGRQFRDLQYRTMNALTRVNRRPIFVLGNQKSGTTAVAALLARMTDQSVTLDLSREVWRPSFHLIPSKDISFEHFVRENRWGFSRDIVKEPNLTLFVDELERHFPEARFAFVVRDPRDNLKSLLSALRISGKLPALEEARFGPDHPRWSPGWELVLDGRWRGIPGDHWIDHLAHRWRFCAEAYLDRRERIVLCRYEDFVADKPGSLRALANTLGCEASRDICAELDTPFQPPGDHSTSWQGFFGEDHLARIEGICAETMGVLGYERSASRGRTGP